jgi:hypothetical protein
MSEKMVRLRHSNSDEINARGHSYRVSPWGTFLVPEDDLGPLLRVGGFSIAREDDPSALHSTVDDVREAAWHLPLGKARSTLLAILQSPNSLNHLIQSIAFS